VYGYAQYNWRPRIGADSEGNPVVIHDAWRWNYVSSAGIWTMDPRLAVTRLDAATGASLAAVVYEGIPGRDRMGVHHYGLAFDPAGGIFVAGTMDTPASGQNLLTQWPFVVKFDASGAVAWEAIDSSSDSPWGAWGSTAPPSSPTRGTRPRPAAASTAA
jgi:hypothetical protein